jgi:hypothetical protein
MQVIVQHVAHVNSMLRSVFRGVLNRAFGEVDARDGGPHTGKSGRVQPWPTAIVENNRLCPDLEAGLHPIHRPFDEGVGTGSKLDILVQMQFQHPLRDVLILPQAIGGVLTKHGWTLGNVG